MTARIRFADVPVLPGAAELARAGFVTGASGRNWTSYGNGVDLARHVPAERQAIAHRSPDQAGQQARQAGGRRRHVFAVATGGFALLAAGLPF